MAKDAILTVEGIVVSTHLTESHRDARLGFLARERQAGRFTDSHTYTTRKVPDNIQPGDHLMPDNSPMTFSHTDQHDDLAVHTELLRDIQRHINDITSFFTPTERTLAIRWIEGMMRAIHVNSNRTSGQKLAIIQKDLDTNVLDLLAFKHRTNWTNTTPYDGQNWANYYSIDKSSGSYEPKIEHSIAMFGSRDFSVITALRIILKD